MMNRTFLAVSLAVGSLLSQSAFAQSKAPTNPNSSAEAPAGEHPLPGKVSVGNPDLAKHSDSTMSRAHEKAMENTGTQPTAGEHPLPAGDATATNPDLSKHTTSTKSRAHVKARTKSENMNGELEPAGEATQPVDAPQKK